MAFHPSLATAKLSSSARACHVYNSWRAGFFAAAADEAEKYLRRR
jgi:hypothetical protein